MKPLQNLLAVPLLLALGACAPGQMSPPGGGPGPGRPALPPPAEDTCNATAYAAQIGQPATALERVLILGPVRVIRPDMMVTMDFSAARINFHVDDAGLVASITCG